MKRFSKIGVSVVAALLLVVTLISSCSTAEALQPYRTRYNSAFVPDREAGFL